MSSVDPNQTSYSVASDLGLHCLFRPVSPNILVHTVMLIIVGVYSILTLSVPDAWFLDTYFFKIQTIDI